MRTVRGSTLNISCVCSCLFRGFEGRWSGCYYPVLRSLCRSEAVFRFGPRLPVSWGSFMGRSGQSIPQGCALKVLWVPFFQERYSTLQLNPRAKAAERKRSRSEADTGQCFGLCFCDPTGRAGRSLRPRRDAQRLLLPASTPNPAGFDPLELRASSAPEDELLIEMGYALAALRAAQSAAR